METFLRPDVAAAVHERDVLPAKGDAAPAAAQRSRTTWPHGPTKHRASAIGVGIYPSPSPTSRKKGRSSTKDINLVSLSLCCSSGALPPLGSFPFFRASILQIPVPSKTALRINSPLFNSTPPPSPLSTILSLLLTFATHVTRFRETRRVVDNNKPDNNLTVSKQKKCSTVKIKYYDCFDLTIFLIVVCFKKNKIWILRS